MSVAQDPTALRSSKVEQAKRPSVFAQEEDPKAASGFRKEEDFLFGSISAAKYQEFNVIKINKRGKRQLRVLGIDGFNIYNIRKSKTKD